MPALNKLIIIVLTALPAFYSLKAQKSPNYPLQEATINYIERKDLPVQIDESSGLMYWNGKLWSHNDSSGADSIYAFPSADPSQLEHYYADAPNKDWEAIDQDSEYIYIGDFGNNKAIQRTDLRIFRIKKNSLLAHHPVVDTVFFHYSNQTDFSPRSKSENTEFDCEAFIVTDDSIYLFTKQWISKNTSLYSLPKTPGSHTANYLATYPVSGLVTDAVYLKSKRILALSGYTASYLRQFIYVFYDFEENNFFKGRKYRFTLNMGLFPHQIEGLATADGAVYYVTNEYQSVSPQRLHTFDVKDYFKEYLLLPETAEKIQGPEYVCVNNRGVTYSIPSIHQAESYEWILPPGVTGSSNKNSITLLFDTVAAAVDIAVRGVNMYGKGGKSVLTVNTIPKPAKPLIAHSSYDRNMLYSSSPKGNQWYDQEGAIKGATAQTYKVAGYGDYYVIVTLNGCSSEPSNTIRTGCIITPEIWPVFSIDTIALPFGVEKLYGLPKRETNKKRKFLFWYF